MKLGDALAYAIFAAIAGTCAAYYLAVRSPDLPDTSPHPEGGRAASLSSEGPGDSATAIPLITRSVSRNVPSEGSSGPEGTPPQGVPEEDRDVSFVQDMSPLVFSSKAVTAFVKEHPNSPLRFVPQDATALQLAYLEGQAEVILEDWTKERDRLHALYGEDAVIQWSDQPETTPAMLAHEANSKNRQARLKGLMLSLWPDCWPKP